MHYSSVTIPDEIPSMTWIALPSKRRWTGSVEALVFTAGVGEHAAAIRARVCENLGSLGLALDCTANDGCQPDADIALPASTGRILVIATREDVTIVRETRRVLTRS
jgi:acetate kinase